MDFILFLRVGFMGALISVKYSDGSFEQFCCNGIGKALIKAMQILPIFICGCSGKGIIFYLLIGECCDCFYG